MLIKTLVGSVSTAVHHAMAGCSLLDLDTDAVAECHWGTSWHLKAVKNLIMIDNGSHSRLFVIIKLHLVSEWTRDAG